MALKMQKSLRYTIFKTEWGYFGFAGIGNALLRTCLPLSEPEKVKSELLDTRYWILGTRKASRIKYREPRIEFYRNLFKILQRQITDYFKGAYVKFSRDIPISLDGFSSFGRLVLMACRDIEFGQKKTYAALAKRLGRPGAARAVGNILAKNPLPLIIPCHRVIRSDGKIGGFSAIGGVKVKEKLLEHEFTGLIRSIENSSNVIPSTTEGKV
ncbi:MAG: hypothetical protein A2167_01240 [Planctomycetes bacterium RBG_13_46_10]|nr:MAG: hypothetical protein A2167_01240 [Planctomycetes bacterium RBG_13_46_10]